jgi:hypothetical protein
MYYSSMRHDMLMEYLSFLSYDQMLVFLGYLPSRLRQIARAKIVSAFADSSNQHMRVQVLSDLFTTGNLKDRKKVFKRAWLNYEDVDDGNAELLRSFLDPEMLPIVQEVTQRHPISDDLLRNQDFTHQFLVAFPELKLHVYSRVLVEGAGSRSMMTSLAVVAAFKAGKWDTMVGAGEYLLEFLEALVQPSMQVAWKHDELSGTSGVAETDG